MMPVVLTGPVPTVMTTPVTTMNPSLQAGVSGAFAQLGANIRMMHTQTMATMQARWAKYDMGRFMQYVQNVGRFMSLVASTFKFLFLLFPIIIVFRMIIGMVTRPLEYLLLTFALIFSTVVYVIYWVFYPLPMAAIPFAIFFLVIEGIPLAVYIAIFGVILIAVLVLCLLMTGLNYITGGAVSALVLCQNSPAAWYKTQNYHLHNKYERGFFCSRPCLPGYYPDPTGAFCLATPKLTPSHCPQASAMRLYTVNRNDLNYAYRSHPGLANPKYLFATPEARELMLKDHYLKKRDFMERCQEPMAKFKYMPLSICSSTDVLEKNGVDKKTVNKIKRVCSQAFCTSKSNYPFCANVGAFADDADDGSFWKRVIKILILILSFLVIFMFTLSYMAGKKAAATSE
jgi:hypothetical protein